MGSSKEQSPVRNTSKTTYGEAVNRLRQEYQHMLELWESGTIFYHFKAFIKKYAKAGWIRYNLVKEPLCAVLALSRLGFPISTASVSFLLGVGDRSKTGRTAYQRLTYLASYNVLEPTGVLKSESGAAIRVFKLTPVFIKTAYRPLKEL